MTNARLVPTVATLRGALTREAPGLTGQRLEASGEDCRTREGSGVPHPQGQGEGTGKPSRGRLRPQFQVGRGRSCTSVGVLRFCQTCLRIRILKLEKETIKRITWFDFVFMAHKLWV